MNMKIRKRRRLLPFGLISVAALILASQQIPASESGQADQLFSEPVDETLAQSPERSFASFAPVVKRVTPAVVRIVTASRVNDRSDLRDGAVQSLRVNIRHSADRERLASADWALRLLELSPGALEAVFLGELNGGLRQRLGIPCEVRGALVYDLHAYSAAAQAGLRPGDVILSVNRQEVGNAGDAWRLTQNARERRALLRVWSNGGSYFLLVDPNQSSG